MTTDRRTSWKRKKSITGISAVGSAGGLGAFLRLSMMETAKARNPLQHGRLRDFSGSANLAEKPLWPHKWPQTGKNFESHKFRAIIMTTKYPGVAYRLGTWFGTKVRLVRLQSLGPKTLWNWLISEGFLWLLRRRIWEFNILITWKICRKNI